MHADRALGIALVLLIRSSARAERQGDGRQEEGPTFAEFLRQCQKPHSNWTGDAREDVVGEPLSTCCTSCLEEIAAKERGGMKVATAERCLEKCEKRFRLAVDETDNATTSSIAPTGDDDGGAKLGEIGLDNLGGSNGENCSRCDSIFVVLNYWGASMIVFANMVYIVPYFIVVGVYSVLRRSRTRAFDKGVIMYNVSQIVLNLILIGIGYTILCRLSVEPAFYIASGLLIMFLTISSTFWLVAICLDLTLVITGFRWAPPGEADAEVENRKFRLYARWAWGLSLLPTAFASVVELSPLVPLSSPIRPNFVEIHEGANVAVIIYVATLPAVACLANSALFCYTSYRMIAIRKATAAANASSTASKKASRRYMVFLRLYILMDAPWITGALGAAFPNLWPLKLLRAIQPMLMLLAILPRRTFRRALECCQPGRNVGRS